MFSGCVSDCQYPALVRLETAPGATVLQPIKEGIQAPIAPVGTGNRRQPRAAPANRRRGRRNHTASPVPAPPVPAPEPLLAPEPLFAQEFAAAPELAAAPEHFLFELPGLPQTNQDEIDFGDLISWNREQEELARQQAIRDSGFWTLNNAAVPAGYQPAGELEPAPPADNAAPFGYQSAGEPVVPADNEINADQQNLGADASMEFPVQQPEEFNINPFLLNDGNNEIDFDFDFDLGELAPAVGVEEEFLQFPDDAFLPQPKVAVDDWA